jgi:hypothetical protein
MKQLVCVPLAALGLLAAVAAGGAQAQIPFGSPLANPNYRSPFSPYLNLTLPGNPAINYYGLIRPQLDQAAALQQLQSSVYASQANPGVLNNAMPITGHASQFQNHWGYFQNWRNRSFISATPGLGLTSNLSGTGSGVGGLYSGTGGLAPGFGVFATPSMGGSRPTAVPPGRPTTPGLPMH